jgi:hypothetical protein
MTWIRPIFPKALPIIQETSLYPRARTECGTYGEIVTSVEASSSSRRSLVGAAPGGR